MNDVKMPIVTEVDGNKITKTCVEDIYKIMGRIKDAIDKANKNSDSIIESVIKDTDDIYPETYSGYLIIGKGTSQPCLTDAFDEEIGNEIAFMKAKLNANIKKHNIICRIYNEFVKAIWALDDELFTIDNYIHMDLNHLRNYNPEYLLNAEKDLGI